ncbi:MAG: hypothetical protein ABSH35_09035 [Isosphaeraceae bacterium]|jgi:hypothetical protein
MSIATGTLGGETRIRLVVGGMSQLPTGATFLLKIIVPSSARVGNKITKLRLACLTPTCQSLYWTGEPRSG